MKLKERVCLTSDKSQAVTEDHPDAAFLLGVVGDDVDDAEADRLRLKDGKAPGPTLTESMVERTITPKTGKDVATKAVLGPQENK